MNRHGNAISGRLSLRQPQRESLEILHRASLKSRRRARRRTLLPF